MQQERPAPAGLLLSDGTPSRSHTSAGDVAATRRWRRGETTPRPHQNSVYGLHGVDAPHGWAIPHGCEACAFFRWKRWL
jgi:hypothetical protein